MPQNPDLKPENMIRITQVNSKHKIEAYTHSEDYMVMSAKHRLLILHELVFINVYCKIKCIFAARYKNTNIHE